MPPLGAYSPSCPLGTPQGNISSYNEGGILNAFTCSLVAGLIAATAVCEIRLDIRYSSPRKQISQARSFYSIPASLCRALAFLANRAEMSSRVLGLGTRVPHPTRAFASGYSSISCRESSTFRKRVLSPDPTSRLWFVAG